MEESAARSTTRIVAVCLFVAIVAIGGAVLAWQLRGDDESHSADGSYGSAGVPWWDGRVHWAGQSVVVDEVASLTATQEAAVFLHERKDPEFGDDEFFSSGRGTLTALYSDGSVARLATEVIGVPLADPNGHMVVWMVEADADTAVVKAFDTEKRALLGSQRVDLEVRTMAAVVGDTVYLSSVDGARAWRPRDSDDPPQVVAGMGPDFVAVVDGADSGLLVMNWEWDFGWLNSDGTPQGVEAGLGSLSPDGQFIATIDNEDQHRRTVKLVRSGEVVDLDLPRAEQAYQTRWAADGTLVVAAVSRADLDEGWDDAYGVTNYACDVPEGDCRALAGGPQVIYHLPVYEDSILGQIVVAFEGIGS